MGQQRRDALEVAFGEATHSDEEEFMFRPPEITPQVEETYTDRRKFTWKGVLAHLGPAFLVSIGYLDPGNWATDIEGGSKFGYKLLWVLILANFMALLLQVLAARMGIVTRSHLAELCRDEYPRGATYALWIMAELAIIATDLTEVLGTAIGINLLFGLPLMVGVVVTALDTFLLLSAQNQGMRRVEQVIFMFLAVISFCFVLELFMSHPSVSGVLGGIFVPRIDSSSLYVATGIVGATVMPHNFYLHSALVIERVPDRSRETLQSECRYNLIDTTIALNAALFINCAILIIAAANFWTRGIEVTTLSKAYHLLENTGFKIGKVEIAPLLFGIALIASGQSSTLCGTLAGQYVMEGFLDLRAPPVIRRLVTRLFAIVPALIVISIMGDTGTYQLLIFCQVVLSLQLPFAIVPMIRFTNSSRRMSEFKNPKSVSLLAWTAAGIAVCLNIAFAIHTMGQGIQSNNIVLRVMSMVCGGPLFVILMIFLGWIALRAETGGPAPVYRVEDENEFVSEGGFELDSLGSPMGSLPTPSPLPPSLPNPNPEHPELDDAIDLLESAKSRTPQLQTSR
ncbi:Natural resistance-associated macrophage protein 2-like [Gracilariopsis chorda]|uniref:Natural resistance-associated macrophage protein 2-like n=1 Tax=Gracilariopsis chorda TaxID=448386 RepID=A0A2V3IJP8_9FLOR|nr:Natural resistance-associated macrophage protein 2-like [Gracilariopsis chorda]|eukprot:PXF42279.1 Natural resistance-associated macrophage protein 2-like [Gracilariopsis chorda]